MYKVVDLFCGAGGMSEGILQAGLEIAFSSDINEDVEKTYRNRHSQLGYYQGIDTCFYRSDIKDLTGEMILKKIKKLPKYSESDDTIDVIFGGPPCQGFSRAGKRKTDDPRNLLFKEYIRIVSELSPRYVVMENVVGLLDMKFYNFTGIDGEIYEDGTVTPYILQNEFSKLGYKSKYKILNAADYGVPQRRNRIIFLAYKIGEKEPNFPEKTNDILTVEDAISDLIADSNIREKYGKSKYQEDSIKGRTPTKNGDTIPAKQVLNNEKSAHTEVIVERFSLFKKGESGTDVKKRLKRDGLILSETPKLLQLVMEKTGLSKDEVNIKMKNNISNDLLDILLTKKNMRIRLDSQSPSPTVVTIADDYISPFENRTFTVRELARLQSFDDSFEFLGKRTTGGLRRRIEVPQYTQVGNAVPPLLAKAIAEEILKCL